MLKLSCLVLGALVVAGSSSCLLYTDSINHPPAVKIVGRDKVPWDEAAKYRADASDPDQGSASLNIEWRTAAMAGPGCPETLEAARSGDLVGGAVEVSIDSTKAPWDKFCVFVVVTDKDKATVVAAVPAEWTHKEVEAVIDVVKPGSQAGDRYELFSKIQLSGAKSRDPELGGGVTLRWAVTQSPQPVKLDPCPQGPDTDRCFTATEPGEYQVELVARSDRGAEKTVTRTLTIEPDRPPCIGLTDPEINLHKIVREVDMEEFAVRVIWVDDDVDPLPEVDGRTSDLRFVATWWRQGDTGPVVRRPAEQERYARVPFRKDYFQRGDEVFVRVQVKDRVDRDSDFAECIKANVDNCALTKRPHCYQWVTWRVRFI